MPHRFAGLAFLLAITAFTGCSRSTGSFSERNARAHVEVLAGTIGSRPSGTEAHAKARAYVIDQLKIFGYQVRVQEADARRPELGRSARVANIIGILPGPRREAIGLLSHYDSRGDTPGAGDDAFGVAVSLEAARLIAASSARQWTTYVLVTDAEEEGLMGAAALMNDPEVRDHLSAYINIESTGSGGPVMLFETGPGNEWLVDRWARRAPRPRGGSFALEIYKRLPNDTDFSIMKQHGVPGLNFAAVGDSYTYHTARDTPDRLSPRALSETGDNVVAIVEALQGTDITARTTADATYFDISGTAGVSYGTLGAWATSVLALILGALGWLRVTRFLLHEEGFGRWLLGLVWMIIAVAVTAAAMVGAAAALRAAREVYHPWYARPDRLFLMVAAVGGAVGWMMARAGRWIPVRARGLRHPAIAWTYTLPVWIALALFVFWAAPAAAYLWTWPLLTAGLLLLLVPASNAGAVRIASVVILAVAATLWLRDMVELLRFMVAVFGRLPIVTPVYVYPALIAGAGLMVAPPLFAATVRPLPLLRPSLATALALAGVAATMLAAWLAPAYTPEQPLRRYVRAIQEPGTPTSLWKVGSLEPGLDLGEGAPQGWNTTEPSVQSIPWGSLAQPFVFSTTSAPLPAAPASVTGYATAPAADGAGTTLSVSVIPKEPSLAVSFVLPAGVVPARSNFPGVIRLGRWTATFYAPPPEGIAWQATFASVTPEQLKAVRVAVTSSGLPGAPGWQRLPAWLPQERAVWNGWFTWVLDPSAPPPIEPVPPLR
ncbi:MAG TPA: M28 family peptidase [Vicinamibacterales bacterium]|nr:M28 family peptidase [Vicinamibacterales bacterium]